MKRISKKDAYYLAIFFIFLFFLFILRLYINQVLEIPFHYDEAQYWTWSKDLSWGYFSKPPLLSWCISIFSNICGDGESCIRSLSPLFYTGTTLAIFYSAFKITKNLYSSIFASCAFLLMPGVTFSSLLISTDVPLLFFSTLFGALIIKIHQEKRVQSKIIYFLVPITLSLAILSKYAAIYLIFSLIIASIILPRLKELLFKKEFLYSFLAFLFLILPNIIWNFQNGFVTFNHTFDNANIKSFSISFYEPMKFFLMQFLIFGIFPFLCIFILIAKYKTLEEIQKILLVLHLLPLLVITLFSIFSRVNANWAVVGYPFGCILLATLEKTFIKSIFKRLIISVQVILSSVIIIFILYSYNTKYYPFKKIAHAKDLALEVKMLIKNKKDISFLADDREDYAHLLYYNRDLNIPTAKWNGDKKINDHYELISDVNNLVGLDVIFLTRTKPTPLMIKRTIKYIKLKTLKYNNYGRKKQYNIYLFKNWSL